MSDSAPARQIDIRTGPSRAYRWVILLFLGLGMFGNYYIYDSIAPLASVLKDQLNFTDSAIGTLNAVYSLPNIIMVLIGGIIIDRIGTRKATFLFTVLCLVGAMVTASSDRFEMMVVGRLIFGLGAESMIVAISAAIAKWFKGKELSFAFAMKITLGRLGSLMAELSPAWGGQFYRDWQLPLLIAVGFGVLALAAIFYYGVLEAGAERKFTLGAAETERVALRQVFSFGKSYWFIVALCFTFYSAIFPFKTFAIKFFQEAHGHPHAIAGSLSGITTMFALVFTPLFGLLADRIGKRSTLMFIGAALLIPVYWMMGFTGLPLIVPMAMMGIAYSLVPAVMWPSVAYLVDGRRMGTAYGLMTMLQNVGLATFNFVIGTSNDLAGAGAENPAGYGPGMIIFSFLGFLALFFAFRLRAAEKEATGHGLEEINPAQEA